TGTPPRLLRRSIDFSRTEVQPGDEPVPYFTYWKEDLFNVEQMRPGCRSGLKGLRNGSMFHVEQSGDGLTNRGTGNGRYPTGSVLDQIQGQLPCYITYTTKETANIIRSNLHKSPLYSGIIEGVGPRYCPSIEDKIVKFPEKERQQIFLEPE